MDAAARTAHDSTLQPFSEMEHYKHADELPPEIMADSYDKLERLCLKYMNEDDFSKVEQAYCFAAEKHCNQKRRSGEMYINHPVEVAIILADLKMDCDVVCAALLHDTVEDTETSLADVSGLFGDTVAELVDGVTKLTNIEVDSMDEKQALTLRKMFLAMSKDIRVIIVKLADRLHNMRTLAALREDRRLFKARETMDVYAPLADRLGMSSIKWELEDLSFFYLEPDAYQRIARMVAESREVRERYLAETIKTLTDELNRIGLEGFQINGRSKHYWSIYQKMKRKGKEFSEIYDLVALRVITHSVRDCYSTLGAVHTLWHPMPGRFKDYIAMPKVNNYQSLHTTVIGPTARPLEIQIRTYEMHEQAEYGIAAHWLYKKSGGSSASKTNDAQRLDDQINWLKHSLDWAASDEITDAKEYLHSLKVDLFDQEIFVFTPKGEVMALRAGSTPLDFAYHIHSDVGHRCIGAKISGRIVPFTYQLQMGDQIEIITQKQPNPSRDWLNPNLGYVTTSRGRSKIHAWFRKQDRDKNILAGRQILDDELEHLGISLKEAEKHLLPRYNFNELDELLAAIGGGDIRLNQMVNFLQSQFNKPSAEEQDAAALKQLQQKTWAPQNRSKDNGRVVVEGVGNLMHHIARCCQPIPGDEIVGFITQGRGISVHRADCDQLAELQSHAPERIVDAVWGESYSAGYSLVVRVVANDRSGLLRDITTILANEKVNVLGVASRSDTKQQLATIDMNIEIYNLQVLGRVLGKLNQVPDVIDARRLHGG